MMGSLAERFAAKVSFDGPMIIDTPCHVWIGSLTGGPRGGYGKILVDGRLEQAHRVSFFLTYGRWPMPFALHRCDNRACVNAAHLFEGTIQDNHNDCKAKDRHNTGVRNAAAKLSESDVLAIRAAKGSQLSIAARYGVSQTTVSDIRRGRYWSHVAALAVAVLAITLTACPPHGPVVPPYPDASDSGCEVIQRVNAGRLIRDPVTGLPMVFDCGAP